MASCWEGPDPKPLALNPKVGSWGIVWDRVGSCDEGPDSRRQCMWHEHQVGQVQLRRLHSISGFEFRVSGLGFSEGLAKHQVGRVQLRRPTLIDARTKT